MEQDCSIHALIAEAITHHTSSVHLHGFAMRHLRDVPRNVSLNTALFCLSHRSSNSSAHIPASSSAQLPTSSAHLHALVVDQLGDVPKNALHLRVLLQLPHRPHA